MKPKKAEIIELLTAAERRMKDFCANNQGDNPQLVQMRIESQAKAEAYRLVLNTLNGDVLNLKIDAYGD